MTHTVSSKLIDTRQQRKLWVEQIETPKEAVVAEVAGLLSSDT